MNNYVIRIEDISKKYTLGPDRKQRNRMLRDVIQESAKESLSLLGSAIGVTEGQKKTSNQNRDFWALKNISFEVQPGESIGIIGRNGAGKSTLLKIISRITWPTTGKVRIRGRVGSLLEVGTGFHQELTGRENVFLNGAILGMRRQEIIKKFDEIVSFSEVENFIDTPVKRYSSGMKMRLAFSVAAHLDPEIMLVDEVLAVGDIAFQRKSLNKMSDVIGDGRTVLFVSHNIAAVRALCQKALFLENGLVKSFGDVDEVAQTYLNSKEMEFEEHEIAAYDPLKKIQILSAAILDAKDEPANLLPHDESFSFRLKMAINAPTQQVFVTLTIYNQELEPVLVTHDFEQEPSRLLMREPGMYSIRVGVNAPLLTPGKYYLGLLISQQRPTKKYVIQKVDHVVPFDIFDNGSSMAVSNVAWKGSVHVPMNWKYEKTEEDIPGLGGGNLNS